MAFKFLYVLLPCLAHVLLGDDVRVNMTLGPVIGQSVDLDSGETINSFYAIPFAEAPCGNLRFKPPVPKTPWLTPKETKRLGPACIQYRGVGMLWLTHPGWDRYSEDCLHLNIHAPAKETGGPFPVMVWVHGGAYQSSANVQYTGHFLARHDVVVVVPNYRQGAFGFMSTGDAEGPGNYGLMDVVLALRFVKENIQFFGGDPNKVTLFGQSAGASSVGLLTMVPEARGLFHQVIMQSGSDLAPWAINAPGSRPETYTQEVARQLHCPTSGSKAMMDCLRTRDTWDLEAATFNCTPGFICLGFAPVVDGTFLPDTPINLRRTGRFAKVPMVTGTTTEDGSLFALILAPEVDNEDGGLTKDQFEGVLTRLVNNFRPSFPSRVQDIYMAMHNHYTPWPHVEHKENNRQAVNMIVTDVGYGIANDQMMKIQSQDAPVYHFLFGYRSINASEVIPEWMGVPHIGEIPYVFGLPLLKKNPDVRDQADMHFDFIEWNQEDIDYSHFVQKMWTDFAKTGNPTPESIFPPLGNQNVTWQQFRQGAQNYLYMGRRIEGRKNYRQKSFALYTEYLLWIVQDYIDSMLTTTPMPTTTTTTRRPPPASGAPSLALYTTWLMGLACALAKYLI